MKKSYRKITGVRLGIAIQVFTTLLILVAGYFAIEVNLNKLIQLREPIGPFQLKMALLNIRAGILLIAFVAFISGLVLTITIRREVKRAVDGVKRISRGLVDPDLPRDPSKEFVPLSTAIRDLGGALNRFFQRSITDAIILVNDELSMDVLNAAAEVLSGYRSDEVRGKPIGLLFPEGQSNETLYRWLEMNGGLSQGNLPQTATVLSKSGEWIHVRLATFQVHQEGRRLRGIVAGVFDMEEWHRIRQEFDRTVRLSTLGLLVTGLAHEIKNPLGSIHGLVQMLAEEIPVDHPRRLYYDTIMEEVNRLDGIMKRLLDLGSPSQWRFKKVSLKGLMEEVAVLMQSEASKRGVRLAKKISAEEHWVTGDADRIKQAVINVLKNAIEATSQNSPVSWALESEGPWAIISVQNQEGSIPRSIVTGPPHSFISEKPEGSGLGLAITYQILHHHGGHLSIQNVEGGGVLVRLFFPIDNERGEPLKGDPTIGTLET